MKKLFTRPACMDLAAKILDQWNELPIGCNETCELEYKEHNLRIVVEIMKRISHFVIANVRVFVDGHLEAQFAANNNANQEQIAKSIFNNIHTFTKLKNPDYNPYVCLEDQILSKLVKTNPWISAHIRCDEDCYLFTMTTAKKSKNDDRKSIQLTLALVDDEKPEPSVRFSKSFIVKELDAVTELVVGFTDEAVEHFENRFFFEAITGEVKANEVKEETQTTSA